MAMPVLGVLDNQLGHRNLAEGQVSSPSMGFILELWDTLQKENSGQFQSWILMVVVFIALNILLTGGILNGYANHLQGVPAQFWNGVRQNFLPLALLPLGFLAVGIFAIPFWRGFTRSLITPSTPLWVDSVLAVFSVWLLWGIWLLYHYTRIHICISNATLYGPRPSLVQILFLPFKALFRSLLLVLTKPDIWILSFVFIALQLVWVIGYVNKWFVFESQLFLWLGQIVVGLRVLFQQAMWGSETALALAYQQSPASDQSYQPQPIYTDPEPLMEEDEWTEDVITSELDTEEHAQAKHEPDEDDIYLQKAQASQKAAEEEE